MPVRSNKVKDQVRRGTEIRWSMSLAGINILVTWAMTATLINPLENRSLRFLKNTNLTPHSEFLLLGVLPSLLCHVVGCFFLLVHYKFLHPWRNIYARQRRQETRVALQEEDFLLEEVRTLSKD